MKANALFTTIVGFALMAGTSAWAAPATKDSTGKSVSTYYSGSLNTSALLKSKKLLYKKSGDTLTDEWKFFPSPKGIAMDDIRVWGNIRFLSIYRNMKDYYPDMITTEKNISVSDYPIINAGTSNNGGVPILELGMESQLWTNISFNVGYSYAHTFQTAEGSMARNASSRSDLRFGGKLKTDNVSISMDAGQVLWTRMSKFTMGQLIYRDNYFDRVPWDWHRRSFDRYLEYYDYTGNIGPEGFGRSPVQGVVVNADIKPAKLSILGVYGRTNRNTVQANSINHFPSITYATRITRGLVTRSFTGKVGVNLYHRNANTDRIKNIKDEIKLGSIDFELKKRTGRLLAEVGYGEVNNPSSSKMGGMAFDIRADLYDNLLPLPVTLEYYNINYNVVSLDGSILNSNATVRDGGYINELIWDNMLYINVAQEVDQIANNRAGLIFKTKKTLGNFKAELGYALSQEKENLHDTITIQHNVNAFSRSRFRPWFQASGPYSRIKSSWMRTFETLTITDKDNGISTDYRKGFNNVELLLKYKVKLFNKDLVLLNYNTYISVQDHLAALPTLNDKAFARIFYEDFTIAYALGKNYMIVGEAGIERVWGNTRVNLSPENNSTINQTGYGLAIGIDYDFHKSAGLHLRHRWMSHKDKNFVLDKFKGQETTLELKIFF